MLPVSDKSDSLTYSVVADLSRCVCVFWQILALIGAFWGIVFFHEIQVGYYSLIVFSADRAQTVVVGAFVIVRVYLMNVEQ